MDAKDRRIEQLIAENKSLKETIKALKETIARLEKTSRNSSKPPKARAFGRRNRKRGGQPGHAKYERTPFGPEQIDRTQRYELSTRQAAGLKPLNEWHVVQQIELKEHPFWIVEYRARKYLDPVTGQIVIALLPPEGVRGGLVGSKLSALIAYQKSACHMSYTTIQTFLKDVFGLPLSTGQLAKGVQKASTALAGPYDELQRALGSQACLGIDETGHPENGDTLWTWCFRAEDFTLFHIDPSRGSQVLKEVLGETFGGVIGCDYFSAYRKYMADTGAWVQFCLAHLIREIRFLAEHSNRFVSRWATTLLGWLRTLFRTLHRRSRLTDAGFARSMDRIRRSFLKAARKPPPHSEAQPLAKRFQNKTMAEAYFTFLTAPNVEPTNNRTERALRPIVIDRRITQGTRGQRGQRWCERAWTVLATCRDQGRNAFEFMYHAVLAHFTHQPTPSLLATPP